jgi:hypothetical protein
MILLRTCGPLATLSQARIESECFGCVDKFRNVGDDMNHWELLLLHSQSTMSYSAVAALRRKLVQWHLKTVLYQPTSYMLHPL